MQLTVVLGRQRPFNIVSAEGPLPGAKRTLKTLEILNCDFRCQVLPGFGFIRLAPHNLSGVVYHETERMGNYLYRGNQ